MPLQHSYKLLCSIVKQADFCSEVLDEMFLYLCNIRINQQCKKKKV
uniref:Uncharacterized protein n=1 Tax=Arundo donax TaxID=35708 RepID=A0A0A9CG88_ARUDO